MGKKEPAFPLVREKEDVTLGIEREMLSARMEKAVPLVFSAATLSSTRCSPGFRVAAAQRDRLQTGRHQNW
jgi:hypothetical protein